MQKRAIAMAERCTPGGAGEATRITSGPRRSGLLAGRRHFERELIILGLDAVRLRQVDGRQRSLIRWDGRNDGYAVFALRRAAGPVVPLDGIEAERAVVLDIATHDE